MKREILFKAVKADGSGWIQGNLYVPNQLLRGLYISPATTCANLFPDLEGEEEVTKEMMDSQDGGISIGKFYEVIPETVCQFVGLTDKNGKKYFFDDIIQDKDGHVGVLVWFNDKLGIGSGEFDNYHAIDETNMYELSNFEIIGNIHDKHVKP